MRKPKWRKSRQTWIYILDNGSQITLGSDKSTAWKQWARIVADQTDLSNRTMTVELLCSAYKDWIAEFRPSSLVKAQNVLKTFIDAYGNRKASTITCEDIYNWSRKFNWQQNTIRTRYSLIKSMFHRFLDTNQLKGLESPEYVPDRFYLKREQWNELIEACTEAFRSLVRFLLLTGARIQELPYFRWEYFHGDVLIIPRQFTKYNRSGPRRDRHLHLNELASQIVEKQLRKNEHIFLNSRAKPWDKNATGARFRRLKSVLGMPNLCGRTLRHSFAHDCKRRGFSDEQIAYALGHTSPTQVRVTYGHGHEAKEPIQRMIADISV